MTDNYLSGLASLFGPQQQPSGSDPLAQYGGLTGLGLSLLANSNTPGSFGSIVGKSALGAQQNTQDTQYKQAQIQQLQQQLQMQQLRQNFLTGNGGQPQGAPPQGLLSSPTDQPQSTPQGQQSPQAFLPGISAMPQGQPSQAPAQPPAQPQSASWLTPPTPEQINSIPVGGMPGDKASQYAVMFGNKDFATAQKETREQQYAAAQQYLSPKIATLDNLIKSDTPSRYMKADPQLMAAWPQLATQAGLDPSQYTDDNVRTALTFARNGLASSVNLPTIAPTNKLVNRGIEQLDPITGEVKHTAETDKFVMPDGSVKKLSNAEGVARGLTPFNQSIFGSGNISDQQKDLAYQSYVANGGKLPAGMVPRSDSGKAAIFNYIAERAKAEGNTAVSITANGQATQAAGNVLKDFTSGPTNKKIVAINTAVAHLDSLNPLIDAMESGNLTLINKARQLYQKQTGVAAPTNYSTLANMAVGETSQAVMAGGGTGPERDELAAPFKSANGPAVLRGAVQTAVTALAGKTHALRTSWEAGTNGTQGSFDRFLDPATKKALGISDQPGLSGPIGVGQSHSVGDFKVTRVN
jgi:hypothetical protein